MSKSPLILIVEDDQWLAEHYVRTLTQAGMQAEWVEHAVGAMELIDAHRPDVIVLDVLLTGQTAFTLLNELRSHADLSIPVILCTNSAADLDEDDVAAYGVWAVLDKATMTPDDLVAEIRKALP